jgi:peptidoglycan/xylan/chitin deacetylase (PgdA/CDA1 family)
LKLSAVPFEAHLDGVSSRRAAAESLLGVLKRVPEATRQAALTELEARLGGAGEHADERRSGALTWDEVREMARGGIEIGSHAVTHPILTQLDDASLAAELSESRRAIESETGQEATTVAYPVGGLHAFDDRVMAASSAAGYRFGVSYLTGVNAWPEIEPYALKRLHVERYTSREYFQCMLVAPRFFS